MTWGSNERGTGYQAKEERGSQKRGPREEDGSKFQGKRLRHRDRFGWGAMELGARSLAEET